MAVSATLYVAIALLNFNCKTASEGLDFSCVLLQWMPVMLVVKPLGKEKEYGYTTEKNQWRLGTPI